MGLELHGQFGAFGNPALSSTLRLFLFVRLCLALEGLLRSGGFQGKVVVAFLCCAFAFCHSWVSSPFGESSDVQNRVICVIYCLHKFFSLFTRSCVHYSFFEKKNPFRKSSLPRRGWAYQSHPSLSLPRSLLKGAGSFSVLPFPLVHQAFPLSLSPLPSRRHNCEAAAHAPAGQGEGKGNLVKCSRCVSTIKGSPLP